MQNLVIALALLITLASTGLNAARLPQSNPSAAQALTCQIRQHRTGPVCWCKRPGGRWQVYPMILCRVA